MSSGVQLSHHNLIALTLSLQASDIERDSSHDRPLSIDSPLMSVAGMTQVTLASACLGVHSIVATIRDSSLPPDGYYGIFALPSLFRLVRSSATGLGLTPTTGKLCAGVEARVVDEKMADVAMGRPGQLLVRGPIVFNQYLDNSKVNREAFVADNAGSLWFRTNIEVIPTSDSTEPGAKFLIVGNPEDRLNAQKVRSQL